MRYNIHGKLVAYDGNDCGIYRVPPHSITPAYAVMDMSLLVSTINDLPKEKAIDAVIALRDRASQQAQGDTSQHFGAPVLRQISGHRPTPIEEVRENIRNTERFCNDVLKALQGE